MEPRTSELIGACHRSGSGFEGMGAKRKLDPGKYTVILEPAAVSDLIGYFGFGIGAREAEQGQSFLSKKDKPGQTLVGEKLFPEYITLRSDPFDTRLSAAPWGPSLVPNERIAWIEAGVMKSMYWDRFWAEKAGRCSSRAFGTSGFFNLRHCR